LILGAVEVEFFFSSIENVKCFKIVFASYIFEVQWKKIVKIFLPHFLAPGYGSGSGSGF
jgi:hypothetical protein